MPKLPAIFLPALSGPSEHGPKVSLNELRVALQRARAAEVEVFARQAIDTIGDGEVARALAERVGPAKIPAPLNSLRDFPVGEAWLAGELELRAGDPQPRSRELAYLLQRAMMHLGAHHPGGRAVPALLQLPYGADGHLGAATVAAVNAALALGGEQFTVAVGEPLGVAVAENIEGLLEETPPLVFPDLGPAPPVTRRAKALFVGMGDHSRAEADRVAGLLPRRSDLIFVGDSRLGDDVVQVRLASGGDAVFHLQRPEERVRLVDTGFTGGLAPAQREHVLAALGHGGWVTADVRDEIAGMALHMHEANRANGGVRLEQLYFSGHSASRGLWGDSNGYFNTTSLDHLVRAFPAAAESVRAVFYAACNHLYKRHVLELLEWFPGLVVCGGYNNLAPGTYSGALRQCEAWARLYADHPEGPISAQTLVRELERVGGVATRRRFHLATWSRSTGLYTYYEESAPQSWAPRAESLGHDPARASELERMLRAELPEFERLLAGTHATLDLRTISADGDTPALRVYTLALGLLGEPAATAGQLALADPLRARALAARHYGRVIDRFVTSPTIAALLPATNRELRARGVAALDAVELASPELGRAAMLAYIARLQAARDGLTSGAAYLVDQLAQLVGRLEGVPEVWL